MKEGKDIFCNLCQKSFTNRDFLHHLPENHLPNPCFSCTICQQEPGSFRKLENHLNKEHNAEKIHTYKVFQFSQLFTKTSEVLSHINVGDEWVMKSFSFGFDNVLSKKEIRELVKNSFKKSTDATKSENSCEHCNDVDVKECNFCCYCDQKFMRKCHLKKHIFKKHLLLPTDIKKAINLCEICGAICANSKMLVQHKNRLHKKRSRKKDSEKSEKTSPFCHFCGKSLANKSNLKRHVLNQHSEEIGAPPNNNVVTCDYCKCYFSNKSSVKRHIENLHLKMKDTRKSISCFHCEQRFNSIKNLNAHLTIEHNITINEEKLHFSNLSEFWEWKKEEEIRTNSRFIQLRGLRRQRRKGEEISTLKFVCNRSGIFHSKSNGKRAYRIKGSSKIGRYCSAYIEMMFKDNALVEGVYCSTHSGHDNDLRYLTLTMDEKREIYEKIKSGATFSAILNEIRNSVGREIKRKHLVTNKDLHNIVTTFKKLSKPSQSTQPNEESTKNLDTCSHQVLDKNERNFNNDLDICADLWVETCQRMINCFDQNEPRSVNDSNKYNEMKNGTINTKHIFVDDHLQHDSSRGKINRMNCCNDFTRNSYVNDYTPNGLTGNLNQVCFKSNYPIYGANTNESRINDLSYFPNVSRTTQPTPLEGKEFCGLSSISNDLRPNKEFYPLDALADEQIDNHIINDIKIPNVYPNGYTSMDSSVESNDSCGYIRNTNSNVYDKLPCSNADPFGYSFSNRIPNDVANPQSTVCLTAGSEENSDLLEDNLIASDATLSDDERETCVESNENNKQNEVSDLRDRVNSVTALYNIVESELDERKKNIIRNYVDNMFRVLQYRYNKCKTKKKQNVEKPTSQDKKPKKSGY